MTARRFMVILVAMTVLATACGGDDADAGASEEDRSERERSFATRSYTTDLTGICPDPIVIQSDWFPEPEHGAVYQLIGSNGTVDPDAGTYIGPLGSTGVDLEIRFGGPYLGGQPNVAVMYQDEDILLGFGSTDMSIQFSREMPTTAVVAPLDIAPPMLMWDPDVHQFNDFADIGRSEATVLVYDATASYFLYLVGKGYLRADQIDGSYDGSPSRFVTEEGLVQVGFVTNEVYRYENEIEQWSKPVEYMLIDDAGFRTYQGSLAVRTGDLEENASCLEALVPLIQQAQVDYITDPEEVNDGLLRIVDELASFWTLSEGGNDAAVETMLDLDIVGNGPDNTLGNFDEERVQALLDDLLPIYAERGIDTVDSGVTADDVVTNRFIDSSIGL